MEEIKTCVKKGIYKKILEEMRRINSDLAQLLNGHASITVVSTQKARKQSAVIERYEIIRQQAKSLHAVFSGNLCHSICPCRIPHNTGFRLQHAQMLDVARRKDHRFQIFFKYQEFRDMHHAELDWCALDFEPLQYQDPFVDENKADKLSQQNSPSIRGVTTKTEMLTPPATPDFDFRFCHII